MEPNSLGKEHPVDIEFHLARRLEDEAPWDSCSRLWTHGSWLDLVETIKTVIPDAYEALKRDLLK